MNKKDKLNTNASILEAHHVEEGEVSHSPLWKPIRPVRHHASLDRHLDCARQERSRAAPSRPGPSSTPWRTAAPPGSSAARV
jgi:hypothetical protein